MKSFILLICIILTSALTTQAQTQEEIDEALKYYPLEVGNYWEYQVVTQTHPFPPETNHYSIEVIGDTTFANGVIYQKLRAVNSGILMCRPNYEATVTENEYGQRISTYFERIDSLTANVYQWKPLSEHPFNEVLIDSLLLEIDEVSMLARCPLAVDEESYRYWYPVVVFGEQYEETYSIEIVNLIYTLVKNYGFVEVFGFVDGGVYTHELIYFRDHEGNEFGEAFDVSTPTPTEIPQRAALLSNYPNPFNPSTTIPFELAQSANVRLEVYDMLGRRVALLVNETRQAGRHNAVFDSGNLSSGVYIARLVAGEQVFSRKMVLVK